MAVHHFVFALGQMTTQSLILIVISRIVAWFIHAYVCRKGRTGNVPDTVYPPPPYTFHPQPPASPVPSIIVTLNQTSELLTPRWGCKGQQQTVRLSEGYTVEVFTVGNRTRTRTRTRIVPPSENVQPVRAKDAKKCRVVLGRVLGEVQDDGTEGAYMKVMAGVSA